MTFLLIIAKNSNSVIVTVLQYLKLNQDLEASTAAIKEPRSNPNAS